MPLKRGKSQEAFEHNVKAEMNAGRPQDQSLAIAYSVKKQAGKKKKKMAHGGSVKNESANTEVRPSPEGVNRDAGQVARNSGNKAPSHDSWTDNVTVQQAQMNNGRKVKPIKHPRMVPSSVFNTKLRDQEDDLMDLGSQDRREEGEKRQGPHVPALDMKMMAKGGKVNRAPLERLRHHVTGAIERGKKKAIEAVTEVDHNKIADMYEKLAEKAKPGSAERDAHEVNAAIHREKAQEEGMFLGGNVSEEASEEDNAEHPAGLEEDDDQIRPPMSRYMSGKNQMLAEGGEIDDSLDHELDMEHEDSIAAAIMAKKERANRARMSDSDMDEMQRLYEGGEVNGHDSIYAHPDEDEADLSRNAEEDANMEDQASFDALRKEVYDESDALSKLDQPEDSNRHGHEIDSDEHDADIVDKIIRKRSRFKQR